MSKHYQMPFTPHQDFVCVKPFVMGGRAYERGDEVDTKGIEGRRLRQMYEARMVDGKARTEAPLAEPAATVAAQEPEAATAPPQPASGGLSVVHKGFSRYFVMDAEGRQLHGPVTKAEAEALVAAG